MKLDLTPSAVHGAIKSAVLFLAAFFLGWTAPHLHGQPRPAFPEAAAVAGLTAKVAMMDTTLTQLSGKVDALKSEADTTQGVGFGIGTTITILQLLGFFVKSKQQN